MTYQKTILTPRTEVEGNIKNFKQTYELVYYAKTDEYLDKVTLYIHLDNEKENNVKSIYFSNHEQLKLFIFELIKAYFHFRDKTTIYYCPKADFRKITLSSFLIDIKNKMLKYFSKNE